MRDQSSREQQRAFRREERRQFLQKRKKSGSVLAGLLFMCVGTLLLMKQFGVPFPSWFFTWPMLIIAFGLMAGVGNGFRDPGWVILCSVGTIFLLDKIWPEVPMQKYLWPILIIGVGFIIILAPRRHRIWHARFNRYRETTAEKPEGQQPPAADTPTPTEAQPEYSYNYNYNYSYPAEPTPEATNTGAEADRRNTDNWLDVVTIFGNVKKLVYSKDFKGGDLVSIFGGTEINLTRADFNGAIVIEVVQIFGGTKLIIPPHWQVRSEMVAVFGGIEDKRAPQISYDETKVVILNGTTFFGGIEIKSY